MSVGPVDAAVLVASLRRNLESLQSLAGERGAMEEAVKEEKKRDNILPKLMATPPQVGGEEGDTSKVPIGAVKGQSIGSDDIII